jgi:hypothetical protein
LVYPVEDIEGEGVGEEELGPALGEGEEIHNVGGCVVGDLDTGKAGEAVAAVDGAGEGDFRGHVFLCRATNSSMIWRAFILSPDIKANLPNQPENRNHDRGA